MRLILVRHGQTAWNAAQRAQGHCDTELDDIGRAQAQRLIGALQPIGIERILSSDLKRSVQTVEPFASSEGIKITKTADLRERHFGDLEGLPYEEVRARISAKAILFGTDPHCTRPENGESYEDVWNRLGPVVEGFGPQSTLVVSHGGTLGLLLALITRAGFEQARTYRFANASITELHRKESDWEIVRLNDSAHLEVAREGFGTGA